MKSLLKRVLRSLVSLLSWVGVRQSEARIGADAQRYWAEAALDAPAMLHWRGDGAIDDETFERLGELNAERFRTFAAALGFPTTGLRILEWGCGGGANLQALAPHASQLLGVDLNQPTLDRAAAELAPTGVDFQPILIDIARPQMVAEAVDKPVDLVLCVNVLELVPGPDYALDLLRIARDVLRPGGMALVQIRYTTGSPLTHPTRALYRLNVATMNAYALDEFWQVCTDVGLTPHLLTVVPHEPLIGERYAYYALTR